MATRQPPTCHHHHHEKPSPKAQGHTPQIFPHRRIQSRYVRMSDPRSAAAVHKSCHPFPLHHAFLFIQGFQAGSSPSSSWAASLPPGDQNLLTPIERIFTDCHNIGGSMQPITLGTSYHRRSYDCTPLTKKKNGPSDQGFFHFRCERGAVPDMSLVITLSVTH